MHLLLIFITFFITGVFGSSETTVAPSPKPTEVCQICKKMVAEARQTLASNLTMGEMKEVFEGTCKILIPIESLSKLCAKYVDELVPEIVEVLYEEMDPTRVCDASGLCYASSIEQLSKSFDKIGNRFAKRIAKIADKVDAESFKRIAGAITYKEESIQNLLMGMCYVLPKRRYSGECVAAIDMYYPIFVKFVKLDHKNGQLCTPCKLLMDYIKSYVLAPEFEKETLKELLKVCDYTESYEDECRSFLNQYFAKLWSILKSVDFDSACKDMGLCKSKTVETVSKVVKFVPLVKSNEECEICKEVVAELKSELLTDEAVSLAKSSVEQLCTLCPTPDECRKYIDKNFEKIYRAIIGKLDPLIICKSLGVCTAGLTSVSADDPYVKTFGRSNKTPKEDSLRVRLSKQLYDFPMKRRISPKFGNAIECTMCQYFVHFMQETLARNETVQIIKQKMKYICKKIPSPYVSDECDTFVDTYAAAIAQLISHEIDVTFVCYRLTKSCPGATKPTKEEIKPVPVPIKSLEMDDCWVCKLVVNYMDQLLEDDKIDDDISELVEKVCALMPKSAYKKCVSIVSTYGPSLLQIIGEEADSQAVCRSVSLCKSDKSLHQLLDKEKCTWGPSYWCKSLHHAQKCNAVDHCSRKIWNVLM